MGASIEAPLAVTLLYCAGAVKDEKNDFDGRGAASCSLSALTKTSRAYGAI